MLQSLRDVPSDRARSCFGLSLVRSVCFLLQNFTDELFLLKYCEGIWFFAGANEAWGDAELIVDGDGDAAFAGAVELGDDESVERAGFVKFLRLLERV